MQRFLAALIVISSVIDVRSHEPLLDFLNFQENHPEVDFNKKCAGDLQKIKNGIKNREIWAMKILDASGKPAAGFTSGNNFWLGRESECKMLNDPVNFPMAFSPTRKMHPDFVLSKTKVPVEYRMLYANHSSNIQFDSEMFRFVGLSIGLCFPKSCRESDFKNMAEIVFRDDFWHDHPYLGNLTFVKTKTLKLRKNFGNDPMVLATK